MTPLYPSVTASPEFIFDNEEFPSLVNTFHLLAALFRYPDEPLWQALSQALPAADACFFGLLGHTFSLPPRHVMEQTYTTLFCANPSGLPAPPYLSCYLEESGRIEGDATLMIRKMLAEEQLIADASLKEPEDHLTVILELAGLLCQKMYGQNPAEVASRRASLIGLMDSLMIMLPSFQAAVAATDLSYVDFYVDAVTLCICIIVLCREQLKLQSTTI